MKLLYQQEMCRSYSPPEYEMEVSEVHKMDASPESDMAKQLCLVKDHLVDIDVTLSLTSLK